MSKSNTGLFQLIIILSIIFCVNPSAAGDAPDGLMVELLSGSAVSGITDPTPEFAWVAHSSSQNDTQAAYHILIASDPKMLAKDRHDIWSSLKNGCSDSINVPYTGNKLRSNTSYYWKVKTWCKIGGESEWSNVMKFTTGDLSDKYATTRYPLTQTKIAPASIVKKGDGHYLIDFGKVAFGFLRLDPGKLKSDHDIEVHFGERGNAQGIITDLGKTTVDITRLRKRLRPAAAVSIFATR